MSPGERLTDWNAGEARLQADAIRLRDGGKLYHAVGEVLTGIDGGSTDSSFENFWFEHGVETRMFSYLVSDHSHWWIQEIWTYDGAKSGDRIEYEDLESLTRTPMGEALEGDLRSKPTSADRKGAEKGAGRTGAQKGANLRIDGLRLTAFEPAVRVRPAPLTGCAYVPEPDAEEGEPPFDLLQGSGEPLEGIKEMTPPEAEALLQELGWCYRFNYKYRVENPIKHKRLRKSFYDRATDVCCSAPGHGTIELVAFGEDRRAGGSDGAIVTVYVNDKVVRGLPTPPPQGTDCPAK